MSVDYFFWLDQIQPHHRDRVGSKAFYLAVLKQRGYSVAPGLVVSSELFQAFLSQLEWIDPTFADLPSSSLHVDVDNARQLQGAAQQIRQAIVSNPIPESWMPSIRLAVDDWQSLQQTEAVILRPSFSLTSGLDPSISYDTRGLLEAKVCRAELETIAHHLKLVWAELFRARSLLYWQRLGIQPQQVQLAVLIQPIQPTIAAGKALVQENEIKVQAVWGLGHGMAGGVIPDRYRVDAAGIIHVETISRKSVAYGVGAGTCKESQQNEFPFCDIEPDDCLQMMMLKPEQQTQPVLMQAEIEALAHLSQRVTQTLDMALELEWMFCSDRPSDRRSNRQSNRQSNSEAETADAAVPEAQGTEGHFYITQVTPYSRLNSTAFPAAEMDVIAAQEADPDRLRGIAAAPGQAVATVWVTPPTPTSLVEMPSGCILVAPMILPEWVSQIRQVAGIITEQGGITSHGAILAREVGIPAIVGLAGAMQRLKTGDRVEVNGDRGEVVWMLEEPEAPDQIDQRGEHFSESSDPAIDSAIREFLDRGNLPQFLPQFIPATATQLMVSLSQAESLASIPALPIDGVGLLRSELLWIESLADRSPEEWLQQDRAGLVERLAQQIQPFAHSFQAGTASHRPTPCPVFYRSLDLRAHEFPMLTRSAVEQNPMLGLRGAYRYQVHPDWFEVELAALRQVQEAGFDNLRLILPFVRTVEEFLFCRGRVMEAGLQQPGFELWIMAEVPSVLLLLPEYIKAGVQGMAIGCNDLTQLLLGVDRDHSQLAAQYNMTHPAVMQAIQQIVQSCRAADLPCTVCGHLPRQLDVIDRLVQWGVTGISVESGDLVWMGQAIDRVERRLILEVIRRTHP